MNILFINTTDGASGANMLAYKLKKGLEKHGNNVSMFVKRKYSQDESVFLINKKNRLLKILSKLVKKDLNSILYYRFHDFLKNDIEYFNNDELLNSQELKKADIVHCHSLHNNYFNLKNLEKISKIKPVVWTLHDMWAFTPHEAWIIKDKNGNTKFSMQTKPPLSEKKRKYFFKKKKEIYSNSNLNIIAISKWMQNKIRNSILQKQKISLIYNGINENIFKPINKKIARQKLNLPQDKKIIMFIANVGKNNKQKGWPYAQKVINHYSNNKDILFLCIGGNKRDNLLSNQNIKYIEYIKDESLINLYYNASDMFLNPSLVESFSLVLAQALATGTPIVTFPVGLAHELSSEKIGYIAKYQDSQDLITGIDYTLNLDQAKIEKISRKSREIVTEKFTQNKMVENYIKLYNQILNKYA